MLFSHLDDILILYVLFQYLPTSTQMLYKIMFKDYIHFCILQFFFSFNIHIFFCSYAILYTQFK